MMILIGGESPKMSYRQKLENPEIRINFRFKENPEVYSLVVHPLEPRRIKDEIYV